MARLPHSDKAIIDETKIRDYVLSSSHPVGRFKAAVFLRMGYTQENWRQLVDDIRQFHLLSDADAVEKTAYGQKYAITGRLKGPNGQTATLRSIWIVRNEEQAPRFVTIYPAGEQHVEI